MNNNILFYIFIVIWLILFIVITYYIFYGNKKYTKYLLDALNVLLGNTRR